jgi:undecaprenyl-diphosphatase
MIDYFEKIDQKIVLFLNGLHSPFLDEVMWAISARLTWIPLYLLLIYVAFKSFERKTFWYFIVFAILGVVIADQCSVHLFKNTFERYRPSHHTELTNLLHFYELKPGEYYKGGQFGFISSHAANFFVLAVFVGKVLKTNYPKLIWILISIGVLISLSRVYLGVHYLSDVTVGALLGTFIGIGLANYFQRKFIVSKP